jgi:hypothetical protein
MDRARKLRLIGTFVIIGGIIVAALVYVVQARSAAFDDPAGFSRGQEHQMKVLMGPLAVAMSGWADAVTSPTGEALIIAAFAAFISYMCFRHARFEDEESEG